MKTEHNSLASMVGRIGVLMGGRSSERVISLRSGRAVCKALQASGFRVFKIDTANGFESVLKKREIDFAFPALHGEGGEDGALQRLLKNCGIPFVGSGEKASASAFDKLRAKRMLIRRGIPTPPFSVLTPKNCTAVLSKWSPPFVLKPIREGSSIGVRMIACASEGLREAAKLLKKYGALLIEKRIDGRELTVPILGGEALPVIEIRPSRVFYDYKAKYTKGLTRYLVPAPIPRACSRKLQAIALEVNRVLGLQDLARIDFKVDCDMRPFVLEANSIPGFTETSLLPKSARARGINFRALCSRLVEIAYKRQLNQLKGKKYAGNHSAFLRTSIIGQPGRHSGESRNPVWIPRSSRGMTEGM